MKDIMKITRRAADAVYYCDAGPNEGLWRIDGSVYLNATEKALLENSQVTLTPGGFTCRQSSDDVKRDLELTCDTCGTVVCDVQDDDSLECLALTAADHDCETALKLAREANA